MVSIIYMLLLFSLMSETDETHILDGMRSIDEPEFVKECYEIMNSIGHYEYGIKHTECVYEMPLLNKTLCPKDKGYDEKNLVVKRVIDESGGVLCVGKVEVTITAEIPAKNKEKIEVTLRRIPYYSPEIFSIRDRYIIEPVGYDLGKEKNVVVSYGLRGVVEFEVKSLKKEAHNRWVEELIISASKNMNKYFDDNYRRYLEIGDEYTKRGDFNAVIPHTLTILMPISKEELDKLDAYKINAEEFSDRNGSVCGEEYIFTDKVIYEDWGGNLYVAGCPRYKQYIWKVQTSHTSGKLGFCFRNDYERIEHVVESGDELFLTNYSSTCHRLGEIVFFEEMLYGSKWFRFKNIYLYGEED